MNFILSATAVTFWAAYDVHVGSLASRWSSPPATYRSLGRMRLSGRKMTASPIKGLYTLSILTFESYPTHLGWFLFRIVVYCTVPSPMFKAYHSLTLLLHFPDSSFLFINLGEGSCLLLCHFKKL